MKGSDFHAIPKTTKLTRITLVKNNNLIQQYVKLEEEGRQLGESGLILGNLGLHSLH